MSTKEMLYSIIDNMSEEQMRVWLTVLGGVPHQKNQNEIEALCGVLHDAANPELISSEKDAWKRAAAEKQMN